MVHDPEGEGPLPPSLRYLKTLVTVLTATMILGLLTMIALFVIRLGPGVETRAESSLPLPDEIVLPQDVKLLSVAWGKDHYVVVTEDERILVYNRSGELLKTMDIK